MSVTPGPRMSKPEMAFVDVRVRSAIAGEMRRRALTRRFGVPGAEQSPLVTLILVGSAAPVLWGLVSRPLPRPHGSEAAIGGAVLNTAFRGLAGPQTAAVPFAGVLIAGAFVSHALRPTLAACGRRDPQPSARAQVRARRSSALRATLDAEHTQAHVLMQGHGDRGVAQALRQRG